MKEFIEKLIGRLEEAKDNVPVNRLLDDIIKDKPKELGQLMAYDDVISIVNQLAEEYELFGNSEQVNGKDTNVTTNDLMVVQSLPSLYPLKDFEEEAIHRVVGNNRWIPCSERLPELTEGTECFKQSPCCLTTLKWWDGDMTESIGWYNQSGVWNEDSKNCKVIAWQPLPAPYQPKGE